MRLSRSLAAGLVGLALALPSYAAEDSTRESPGFFARTWQSVKALFGAAKEDGKDAAQTVGDVAVEGGKRAANAGRAVGKAFSEGAKDVKEAVVTPSDQEETGSPGDGQ